MPPSDPPPPTQPPRPAHRRRRPAAPALPDVVARLVEPLAEATDDPLRRIRLAWGRICGAPLGRHIEPMRLEGGTLHVGARGPIWRDAVFHERAVLVRRIRRYVPTVERIWLHTLPGSGPPVIPSPPRPELTDRTDGISDPELRLALERLLASRRGAASDDG